MESLQACSFKITMPKDQPTSATKGEDNSPAEMASRKKGKKKKKEEILDEGDTTRGSRVVLHTPHRLLKKPAKLPPSHKQSGKTEVSAASVMLSEVGVRDSSPHLRS